MTYQYVKIPLKKEIDNKVIKRVLDQAFIPFDPANTDYQEYLKWLDEGNPPEPADPVGE